jgi:uncharacterized damage-inducible protein DinB
MNLNTAPQLEHFRLLARYNEWMNGKVYAAAAELSAAELTLDRQAFFGSIIGTLNHLVVGDTIWLKRFAKHPSAPVSLEIMRQQPAPIALNQILFSELAELRAHRQLIDWAILAWTDEMNPADLTVPLAYTNTKGTTFRRDFASLLVHYFNHQTHHRGQASTLLLQAGQDIGETDLLALIPTLDQ